MNKKGKRKMNIYEKLLNITTDLKAVAKNLQVGDGKFSYKAVGEADVLNAVKPLEAKYKVYSYPCNRQVIESEVLENTNYKGEVKKSLFLRIETTYRFVNIEEPTEYIDITTYGDGIDTQDKAPGKAMTYGDKYALLKAYKIMTGEDPDQEESKEVIGTKKEAPNNQITNGASTQNSTTDYRKKLIEYCQKNKVDMKEIAKAYGINGATTQDRFKQVLKELGVE